MSDVKEAILSKTVRAGSRTYFFDVKESVKSDKYLIISESKKKNGEFEKHRLMVFEDDFKKFFSALKDIEAKLQ